jgi:hypothetical protein
VSVGVPITISDELHETCVCTICSLNFRSMNSFVQYCWLPLRISNSNDMAPQWIGSSLFAPQMRLCGTRPNDAAKQPGETENWGEADYQRRWRGNGMRCAMLFNTFQMTKKTLISRINENHINILTPFSMLMSTYPLTNIISTHEW